MQSQLFHRVVADDFAAVDEIIRQQLSSRVPLVEKIGDYIISAGGKRLRPLLVLLAGRALGYRQDDLRLLAAIIEFLHTSTLLHDDVVDMSGMRRGRSTANALWGNAPSVLVGDFLYARSFEMMVALGSMLWPSVVKPELLNSLAYLGALLVVSGSALIALAPSLLHQWKTRRLRRSLAQR